MHRAGIGQKKHPHSGTEPLNFTAVKRSGVAKPSQSRTPRLVLRKRSPARTGLLLRPSANKKSGPCVTEARSRGKRWNCPTVERHSGNPKHRPATWLVSVAGGRSDSRTTRRAPGSGARRPSRCYQPKSGLPTSPPPSPALSWVGRSHPCGPPLYRGNTRDPASEGQRNFRAEKEH